jgi:hypothetical protein
MPLRLRQRLLRSLTRSGIPWPFEIGLLNPLEADYVVSATEVLPAEVRVIDPVLPELTPTGHYWSAIRTYRLANVTVDPSSGLVFADDRLIPQSGDGLRDPSDIALLSSALPRARSAIPSTLGPVIPVPGTHYKYYHFLIEVLPRLLLAHETTPDARVLLSEPVPDYVRMALDAIGLPYILVPAQALRGCEATLCDPASFGWPHPGYLPLLRGLPVGIASPGAAQQPSRLYISRSGSARTLHQEEDLERYLESHGFQVARLEDHDWTSQVRMFRSAEIVVAPHGAGLANTVFMPAGGRVVELTSGDWWYPCFVHISAMAGLTHEVVRLAPERGAGHGTAAAAIRHLERLGV